MSNDYRDEDIIAALELSRTGTWRLEATPGEPLRFYGDHIMNELIGISDEETPENRYDFFMSRVHKDDIPFFMAYYENLKKEQSEIVYRYEHPTLGTIYVRCAGKREDPTSTTAVYRGFHQNINETVRVEHEKRRHLTEVAELYQSMASTLMENLTQSAMYVDLDTKGYKWLCLNDDRMVGEYDYGELGRLYASFMPEEYGEIFLEKASIHNLKAELKNKNSYSFSVYAFNDNGELRRTTMWYYVLDDSHKHVLSVSQDTTEDYRKEQKLANALLEAKKANQAKTNFLNNMSHEIRTPMNAIIGFCDLAIKNIDEKEKCLDYLSKVGVSCEHLLMLINDILDMSRIESGKVTISENPASITEIMNGIETDFQTMAKQKGLKLTIESDIVDDVVLCDKLRINQVLINCVSNSIKFTEEGGYIDVKVSQLPDVTRETNAQGIEEVINSYRFTIRDTGIGMSQEFLKTIFDSFTRDEAVLSKQIQGTGLGMSICKNIVDLMGGTIEVESKLEEGSTFTITIPLKKCEVQALDETDEENDDENDGNVPFSLDGKKMLLVEDNELNREIASEILSEFGTIVETAENGQIAVDLVTKNGPKYYDCILMDIQMPVLNGYDATRAIRAMDGCGLTELVIVALSANAFEEDKKKACEAGMNDHVAKPIDIPTLVGTLEKYLK